MSKKRVFEYTDYRIFLKDRFEDLKAVNPKFSYRAFSKLVGMKSASFLHLVMHEKANLSPGTVGKIGKALELDKDEAFYFKNLVLMNQAALPEDKQLYARQLMTSKGYRKVQPLSGALHKYLTHWYYVAISELVELPGFKEDPRWISERLDSQVTAHEVSVALNELVRLGFLSRDKNNKIIQTQNVILSPDEVTSNFVGKFHEEFIHLAGRSISRYSREARDISATTFRLSKKGLNNIKEIVRRFRKEIVEVVALERGSDGVYQLNIQLFPLASFPEDKESS